MPAVRSALRPWVFTCNSNSCGSTSAVSALSAGGTRDCTGVSFKLRFPDRAWGVCRRRLAAKIKKGCRKNRPPLCGFSLLGSCSAGCGGLDCTGLLSFLCSALFAGCFFLWRCARCCCGCRCGRSGSNSGRCCRGFGRSGSLREGHRSKSGKQCGSDQGLKVVHGHLSIKAVVAIAPTTLSKPDCVRACTFNAGLICELTGAHFFTNCMNG